MRWSQLVCAFALAFLSARCEGPVAGANGKEPVPFEQGSPAVANVAPHVTARPSAGTPPAVGEPPVARHTGGDAQEEGDVWESPPTVGEPSEGGVSAPCEVPADCRKGLVCTSSPDPTGPKRCRPKGGEGDPCLAWFDCEKGSHCNHHYGDGDVGECLVGSIGTLCTKKEECASKLVCTSAKLPGEPRTCQRRSVLDEPCQKDGDCVSSLTCNMAYGPPDFGLCRPIELGEKCLDIEDCGETFFCGEPSAGASSGTCRPFEQGDPCAKGDYCGPLLVCDSSFAPPTCVKPLYASCASDRDCGAGSACVRTFSGLPGSWCSKTTWYEDKTCSETVLGECNQVMYCGQYTKTISSETYPVYCQQCAPLPGSQERGMPCASDPDCATGLKCTWSYDGGRCGAPVDEGGTCQQSQDCASGLLCNHALTPPSCVVPGKPGSPCSWGPDCEKGLLCWSDVCFAKLQEGEPCEQSFQCHAPLVCSTAVPHVCEKPLYSGCSSDGECGRGMVCAEALGGFDGSCTENGKVYVGSLSDGCSVYEWQPIPQPCSQCVPAPGSLELGDKCPFSPACAPGLACHAVANECYPLGALGDPCGDGYECVGGLACRSDDGITTCGPPKPEGEPCLDNAECEPSLACLSSGACGPTGDFGAPCGTGSDCVPGLVCQTTSGVDSCATLGEIGSHCHFDEDCSPSLLCGPTEKCLAPMD